MKKQLLILAAACCGLAWFVAKSGGEVTSIAVPPSPSDLNAIDTPTDGQTPVKAAGVDQFEWVTPAGVGDAVLASSQTFTGQQTIRNATPLTVDGGSITIRSGGIVIASNTYGIQWADGTVSTTASSGSGGGGDAYLANDQEFTGVNTWASSATFNNADFSVGVSTLVVTGGQVGVGTQYPEAPFDLRGAGLIGNNSKVIARSGEGNAVFTIDRSDYAGAYSNGINFSVLGSPIAGITHYGWSSSCGPSSFGGLGFLINYGASQYWNLNSSGLGLNAGNCFSSTMAVNGNFVIGQSGSYMGVQGTGGNFGTTGNPSGLSVEGKTSIGAPTASARLDIVGTASDTYALRISTAQTQYDLVFTTTGRMGLGVQNPAYPLDITGAVNSTGGFFKNGVEITGGGSGTISTTTAFGELQVANSTGTFLTTATTNTWVRIQQTSTGGDLYNFTQSLGQLTYTASTPSIVLVSVVGHSSETICGTCSSSVRRWALGKNGSVLSDSYVTPNTGSAGFSSIDLTSLVSLGQNDTVEVYGFSDATGTLFTNFTMTAMTGGAGGGVGTSGGGTTVWVEEDGTSKDTAVSTFNFTTGLNVVSSPSGEVAVSVDPSTVTMLGPTIPANKIDAGSLGASVMASSVSASAFYSNATVRSNLGLAIGTNVQAWDADLDDLADGSLTATKIAAGSLGSSVIASSITLAAMYGAPTLVGTNFTSLPGAQVGSGVPAANIANGSLGASVLASSIAVNAVGPNQLSGSIPDSKLNQIATDNKVAVAAIAGGTLSSDVLASSVTLGAFYSSDGVRANLGLAIDTNVQSYDATLADLANAPLGEADSVSVGAIAAGSLPADVIASSVAAGAVGIPQLSATGSPSGSTFLRGDGTWSAPAGSGDAVLAATQTWSGGNTWNSWNVFNGSMTVAGGATFLGSGPSVIASGTNTAMGFCINGTTSTYVYTSSAAVAGTMYATTFSGSGAGLTAISTGNLNAGGTPSASTYLRGDNTWATPTGGTGEGDNLGNHVATMTVTAGYGISATTITVSTLTVTTDLIFTSTIPVIFTTQPYAGIAVNSVATPQFIVYPASVTMNGNYVLTTSSIGVSIQAWDTDLDDLADGSLTATKIANGSLGSGVIASSITLAAMYGAPALVGTNFTSLPGAQVGSGVPAANIASGSLGSQVVASSIALAGFYSADVVRTNLGLAIGSNVQAFDADLTDLADGSLTATKIAAGSLGASVIASSASTTLFYNSPTIRTNLGLAIGTNVQAYDATLDDLAAAPLGEDNSVSATAIAAGTLPTDVMASSVSATGTPSASTYLRGDMSWATVSAGSVVSTRTYAWSFASPATGGIVGPRIGKAQTVTRIDCYVTAATSVTFNIEERATIGSAGTNLMTADLAADTDGATQTTFADSALAEGNWLWLDISAVSGTPGQCVIVLTYTQTD